MPFDHRSGRTRGPQAWITAACLLLVPVSPRAQIALPGAVAPTPEGGVVSPDVPPPRKPRSAAPRVRVTPVTIVPATSLAGRTLALDGARSQVTFELRDRSVAVAHLTLSGETVGDTRQTCTIEVPGTLLAVTAAGRPDGVERLRVEYPACPVEFDVLDGAVLVDRTQGVCEFKERACRVDPVGLWGPQASDLGADRVKGIERARAQAETTIRANYKALVASTKDRVAIAGYARDQAQFSSTREELCREYVGEGRHGFCAAKLAEARAAFLGAALTVALDAKAERKKERAARRSGRS